MPDFNVTFRFEPVTCNRGNKWKGDGWLLGTTTGCYGNLNAVIWEPLEQHKVYATLDFCKPRVVSAEERNLAAQMYVASVVRHIWNWCLEQRRGAPEEDIYRFAVAVLRKHHSELPYEQFLPEVEITRKTTEEEIKGTLEWAAGLRTKSCCIYGKWMPGGNPYPKAKQLEFARKALAKRGVTARPDFEETWNKLTR